MFRRNPDKDSTNLFDSTDAAPEAHAGEESATVVTSTSTSPINSGSSVYGSSASIGSVMQQPSSPISRPLSEPRSNPVSASGFRAASAPLGAERSRLPEAKAPGVTPSMGVGVDKSNKSGRRVLTVGNDILLKGEIATCDRLVIEGKVDATLNDVHTVEISETGSFKGSANIEDAEISGLFEGDLVVRNRLVIYATGKVRGKISYGEIEIERGGELTGDIKMGNGTASATRPARAGAKADDKVAA